MNWQPVIEAIISSGGEDFSPDTINSIGGGCINAAYRLSDSHHSYFVKTNSAKLIQMFEAESAGLNEMLETHSIRVPKPLCVGESDGQSWLVMEYIPIGSGSGNSQRLAGEQLAEMHRKTSDTFGWSLHNTIGSTEQINSQKQDWIEFWRDQRLGFQLGLAASKGYTGALQLRGEKLLERFEQLIDHNPLPSLLHGDLWGGNIGFDADGCPVIFDPAVYYGDREADIAMTELFGGFSADFYAAYNAVWQLDSGYQMRKTLYNLYHILNHLNLFGSGYAGQAQGMIDRLLAEVS